SIIFAFKAAPMETVQVHDKHFALKISEATIQARVSDLAATIDRDYEGRSLLLLAVLNGAFVFAADLIRALRTPSEIEFVRISSYGDAMQSSGKAQMSLSEHLQVKGRDVLVVEDIVDSGFTTRFFMSQLQAQGPASVALATLLFKPDNFQAETPPQYIGFDIPPDFVVGYGMDYAQQGRNLRGIYTLAPA
ncbi:MAG: hypoxanthine phosphoribosyltransferase, partial [Bacteroidetes bacterium]